MNPSIKSITETCSFIETDKETLTMTTEDGDDILCRIVRIFHTPESDYIVLLPDDGRTEGDGYLYRFAILADGSPDLANLKDDAEYAYASEVFRTLNTALTLIEEDSE